MVSDSDGSRFDHFCGSSLVESHRWCSGVDLDHRLVRTDNGCSGDHFWLSLAQPADTGNPLIKGKASSVLPSEDSGPFCVSWKRHRPVRKLFVAGYYRGLQHFEYFIVGVWRYARTSARRRILRSSRSCRLTRFKSPRSLCLFFLQASA